MVKMTVVIPTMVKEPWPRRILIILIVVFVPRILIVVVVSTNLNMVPVRLVVYAAPRVYASMS